MGHKAGGSSPLSFKAGGGGGGSPSKKKNADRNESSSASKSSGHEHDVAPTSSSPNTNKPSTHSQKQSSLSKSSNSNSNILTIVQTGILHKRSPLSIQNWIACVLTLDGRDKFTKVVQYTSRLLCWYFSGLASKAAAGASSSSGGGGAVIGGASAGLLPSILTPLLGSHLSTNNNNNNNSHSQQLQLQLLLQQFYQALSIRCNSLYKTIVTSRKAFRLGRSIIEADKIRSMGWGDYLGFMLLHPLAGGVLAGGGGREDGGSGSGSVQKGSMEKREGMGSRGTLHRYDTHPIPEEEEGDENLHHNDDGDGDDASWSGEEHDENNEEEEKKQDDVQKVVSRPGRPKLPSRISSNVGWGPSTTSSSTVGEQSTSSKVEKKKALSARHQEPPARTVSELGKEMYRPFPSRSSSMGSYKQVKEAEDSDSSSAMALATAIDKNTQPPTPTWKLVGGTIKLVGLMGFWAFDNIAFLTGSGFLDPIKLVHPSSSSSSSSSSAATRASTGGGGGGTSTDPATHDRLVRKKRASEWAGRCYFFGVVAGLYVNARALWNHRNTQLRDARQQIIISSQANTTKDSNGADNNENDANVVVVSHLKQIEQKHFCLLLALLKSCCDFMVFSNNPGIDLHLKLRGRKNHEGLHCLGGLVSAGTVLYNNFPNAK